MQSERERIARIINPLCFDDAWKGYAADTRENREILASQREEALAKADAILALRPSAPEGGNSRPDKSRCVMCGRVGAMRCATCPDLAPEGGGGEVTDEIAKRLEQLADGHFAEQGWVRDQSTLKQAATLLAHRRQAVAEAEAGGLLASIERQDFTLRDAVCWAIADPGTLVGDRFRSDDGHLEALSHWQARAALAAVAAAIRSGDSVGEEG